MCTQIVKIVYYVPDYVFHFDATRELFEEILFLSVNGQNCGKFNYPRGREKRERERAFTNTKRDHNKERRRGSYKHDNLKTITVQ